MSQLDLALTETIPVLLGVLVAGYLARWKGIPALWLGLAAALANGILIWALPFGGQEKVAQRLLAPLAVYAPPLLLAGVVLSITLRRRLSHRSIIAIAILVACANLVMAQFFFATGCAIEIWDCP